MLGANDRMLKGHIPRRAASDKLRGRPPRKTKIRRVESTWADYDLIPFCDSSRNIRDIGCHCEE